MQGLSKSRSGQPPTKEAEAFLLNDETKPLAEKYGRLFWMATAEKTKGDFDPILYQAQIDRGDPLEVGSVEEIEIRAAALHAVDLLKQRLHEAGHRKITSMDLDYLLWNRGQAARYKAIPRHRARGVFY